MKKIFIAAIVAILFVSTMAFAAMTGKDAHEKYLYPIVRVSIGASGGSGTLVFSGNNGQGFSNYVLTNHHVVADAIKVEEKWDSNLQKNSKVERRALVYVEIFKYKNLGTPIGTMKIEADIVIYDEVGDMALLKLRLDEPLPHVATMPNKNNADKYFLFDETIAVGCSLGFSPISTLGIVARKNFQIDSLPYHMSTSQTIFGNSGGAIFLTDGTFIGIPSRIPVIGWGTPITHMGLFIPIDRIYQWFEKEYFDFIFDHSKNEIESLKLREKSIKTKSLRN